MVQKGSVMQKKKYLLKQPREIFPLSNIFLMQVRIQNDVHRQEGMLTSEKERPGHLGWGLAPNISLKKNALC